MSASACSEDEAVGEVVYDRGSGTANQAEDWDDTSLIEAYDAALGGLHEVLDRRRATTSRAASSPSQAPSSSQTKWVKGQYCKAQYSVDKQWYEAKIKAVEGDYCLVEYLGYLNVERKPLADLRPSVSAKQRQRQIKSVEKLAETDSDQADYVSDYSEESLSGRRAREQDQTEPSSQQRQQRQLQRLLSLQKQQQQQQLQPPEDDPLQQRQQQEQSQQRQKKQAKDFSRKRGAKETSPPCTIAFPPPPPPFPPGVDEICGSDEAMAAMLISWYISGYHTGYYTAVRKTSGH